MSRKIFILFAVVATILLIVLPATAQRNRGRPMTRVDLLVLNGTLVTMDKEHGIIPDAGVAIAGGRIVAVGSSRDILRIYAAPERVDASGKIIIPGLINGHTHIPMTLFRGLADDLDLQEWLTKYIFPAEAKNVSEELYARNAPRLSRNDSRWDDHLLRYVLLRRRDCR